MKALISDRHFRPTRRDALRLGAVGAATIVSGLCGFSFPPEDADDLTELHASEPLVNTEGVVEYARYATDQGYQVLLAPKEKEGQDYDPDNLPGVAINDFFNGKLMPQILPRLHELRIEPESQIGIGKEYGFADWAIVLRKRADRKRLIRPLTHLQSHYPAIPAIMQSLDSGDIAYEQILVLPPRPEIKAGIIIWTNAEKVSIEKLEAPDGEQLWIPDSMKDNIELVSDGIIRIFTRKGDEIRSRLYSVRAGVGLVPNSGKIMREVGSRYSIVSFPEADVRVEIAPGGGVYRYEQNEPGTNSVSIWDTERNEFSNPIAVRERLDYSPKDAPVFVFGEYFAVLEANIQRRSSSDPDSSVSSGETVLAVYNIYSGNRTSHTLKSLAALNLVRGSFLPAVQRGANAIRPMSRVFGKAIVDSLQTVPNILLTAPGEFTRSGNDEALLLIRELAPGLVDLRENPALPPGRISR